ncbi:ribosomal RNA small subunit methyltransferase A [Spirochaetota bacterium]|nr:ribosomal RNA small subunit methyltransferase A [Spirochaetota bacterium]
MLALKDIVFKDLTSPRELQHVLTNHPKSIKKSLGQHYLIDKNIVRKITALIETTTSIAKASTQATQIIEIGAGLGTLTASLLSTSTQSRIIAIEVEQTSAHLLKNNINPNTVSIVSTPKDLRTAPPPALMIITADVFAYPWPTLLQALAGHKITFVGNLPYRIATRLIIYLLENYAFLTYDMVFMVQREVAQKLTATPSFSPPPSQSTLNKATQNSTPKKTPTTHSTARGTYGVATLLITWHATVRCHFSVSPNSFYPKPKITSQIISIKPKPDLTTQTVSITSIDPTTTHQVPQKQLYPLFKQIIKTAFSKRRKTIQNALHTIEPDKKLLTQRLLTANIDPKSRPEQLSLAAYTHLATLFYSPTEPKHAQTHSSSPISYPP